MTETATIIEDAIVGGFSPFVGISNDELTCKLTGHLFICEYRDRLREGRCTVPIEVLLMQPEFWQAAGRTRGWAQRQEDANQDHPYWKVPAGIFWQERMHGKDVEEVLAAIK